MSVSHTVKTLAIAAFTNRAGGQAFAHQVEDCEGAVVGDDASAFIIEVRELSRQEPMLNARAVMMGSCAHSY